MTIPVRLIASSLLLGSFLYGQSLSPVESVSYEKAKKLYLEQSYEEAYPLLSTLYLNALDNIELNFYLGRSAYELKEYPAALAAFERVTFLDPNNFENQIELARTQYKLGLYDEAKTNFKVIRKAPEVTEGMKKTIDYYLESIAKQQQRNFLFLTARGGLLYDSNVNFGSADESYTLPTYGIFPAAQSRSDMAHEETAGLTHLYDIGERGGVVLRNRFSLYNRSYFDETDYNMMLLSYYPALTFTTKRSAYELIGGINRFYLGDKDFYTSYSVNPKWSYFYTPNFRQILSFKVGQKNHFEFSDLDSHAVELSTGWELSPSSTHVLRTDLVASRQIKERGGRADVSYHEYIASFLYTYQLHPRMIFQFNANAKQRLYEDFDPLFLKHREDVTGYGSFNMVQRLNDVVSFQESAGYTHTNSSVPIYSYDKYTLSLSVSGRF